MLTLNKKPIFPLIALFLLISTACSTSSIPFLETTSEKAPVEAIDPDALETMIAASVDEKISQTLEAMPPTYTSTPLPTEAPTLSPTATQPPPSATPTQVNLPKTGSALIENADGSLTFFDYKAEYSLNPPTEWLALRPDSPEYREAWITEASNPVVISILKNMEKVDSEIQRLYTLDLQKEHYKNGFITYANIALDHENGHSLEESFADYVLNLPNIYSGVQVISSDITETSSGIRVGIVVAEWHPEGYKDDFRAYEKTAIFAVKDRMLFVIFSTTVDLKDETFPLFDAMIDSFQPLPKE